MGNIRPEYRATVEKTLREFVRNGDDVMCVAVFCIQDRTCQVCGHHPITWNYLIENLVTHQVLIAGSGSCAQDVQQTGDLGGLLGTLGTGGFCAVENSRRSRLRKLCYDPEILAVTK